MTTYDNTMRICRLYYGSSGTYEVGASGNRVTGDDCSADAGDELFTRDDLFSHEMTAALRLDLVLDVACGEPGADILSDSASDHSCATETIGGRLA